MIYLTRHIIRLCRKSGKQGSRFCSVQVINRKINEEKVKENKGFESIYDEYKDKIIFSSYIDHEKVKLGYYQYYMRTTRRARISQSREFKEKCLTPLPIALRYYVESDKLLNEERQVCDEPEKRFQLPFANSLQVSTSNNNQKLQTEEYKTVIPQSLKPDPSAVDKWMTNYEHFDDTQLKSYEEPDEEHDWHKHYGTPDATMGVSQVPCGGCGALFHCSDPSIPGYLPSEIFRDRTDVELKAMECQRCHFLKEYNIALDVSVSPEEYEKLLQSIRHVKSLVVLMVDLLDFPCSIWPGIVDIIGSKRPIVVVGNKVDLLPGDSIGYLKRIKECLITEINKTMLRNANIKHVSLLSAKTGYGVEDFISTLFKIWLGKGDVYLVGCTNVGKSSLFNALIQSDYCKVHAVDLVKRATVSRWPGTTLNLLKFPINRPDGWKIYHRTKRLESEAKLLRAEQEIRKSQVEGVRAGHAPALIGRIGRSFSDPRAFSHVFCGNSAEKQNMVLNEKDELFKNSKWFYDTPGVVHPDQILSLLTTEELLLTIPKDVIRPQTYYIGNGTTIFIAGLARIDHVESSQPCRYTIFCSDDLPITVTKTEDAQQVYERFLGTEPFAVPVGGSERIKNWPGLKRQENLLEFKGEGPKWCCGDIVLSSVGWVSVTAKQGTVCKVAAWTPEGRGIYMRHPSILPYSINLKGKRIRDTPAYMAGSIFREPE